MLEIWKYTFFTSCVSKMLVQFGVRKWSILSAAGIMFFSIAETTAKSTDYENF